MAVPFCSNISVINSVFRNSAETYNYVVNWTFAYAKLFPNVTVPLHYWKSEAGNQERNPVAAAEKKSAINCNRIKSRGGRERERKSRAMYEVPMRKTQSSTLH